MNYNLYYNYYIIRIIYIITVGSYKKSKPSHQCSVIEMKDYDLIMILKNLNIRLLIYIKRFKISFYRVIQKVLVYFSLLSK